MHDHIRIIPAAELPTRQDSAGTLRVLAGLPDGAEPAGDPTAGEFLWRAAVREFSSAGPLPTLEDADCILMLTEGGPLDLTDSQTGRPRQLEPAARLYFAAETPFTVGLPAGPVQGFELLLRRKQAHGCVDMRRGAQALPLRIGDTILHCTQGAFRFDFPPRMGGPRALAAGDTLHLTLDYLPAFRLNIAPEAPGSCLIDARMNLYPGVQGG